MFCRTILVVITISSNVTSFAQKNKSAGFPNSIPAIGIIKNLSDSALLEVVERQTFRFFWHAVADTVKDLLGKINGHDSVIGISAPGLPSHDHTAIAYMPGRMQGLENFLWQEFLQRPTYVLNDAVAALIAEATSGAAKNRRHGRKPQVI